MVFVFLFREPSIRSVHYCHHVDKKGTNITLLGVETYCPYVHNVVGHRGLFAITGKAVVMNFFKALRTKNFSETNSKFYI